jgi:hypothetical protein
MTQICHASTFDDPYVEHLGQELPSQQYSAIGFR